MEYLFNDWNGVSKKIDKNNLVIFLDFDGTLTPIVSIPKKAVLPEAAKKLLTKMSENPDIKLAFVSGRRIEDIKSKIKIKKAVYSGNHGFQLEGPKIKFEPVIASGYRMVVDRIKCDLEKKIAHIQGAFIEDKGVILSLHYRLVDKKKIVELKTIFHKAVISHLTNHRIEIREGKMVLEVRPPEEWDKGSIVMWLLAKKFFSFKGGSVLPIYIGDDKTDEDAFKALRDQALTIRVGKSRTSAAHYYLKDVKQVHDLLSRIAELKK